MKQLVEQHKDLYQQLVKALEEKIQVGEQHEIHPSFMAINEAIDEDFDNPMVAIYGISKCAAFVTESGTKIDDGQLVYITEDGEQYIHYFEPSVLFRVAEQLNL